MNETLKKGMTITLSVMTAVWSIGITAFAPVTAGAASAAASEGDLVKASLASVYYYGSDAKRYVFPNQKTYDSWYADFSSVQTVTDSELAAMPIGGNATYAPGSKMLKITTDPKTYLPGAAGMLYHVTSEAVATGLFGSNWSTDVHDVPDAFFTNYSVSGSTITASEAAVNLPSDFAGLRYFDGTSVFVLGMDMEWHKVIGASQNPNHAYVEAAKFNAYPTGSEWTMAAMWDLWDPARLGTQDGGGSTGPAPEDVSVTVKKMSKELAMNSAQSQNVGVAEIEVCADNATLENIKVDYVGGTAFDTVVFGHFLTEKGQLIKESGSEDSDRVSVYEADTSITLNGCETWYWFNAITTNGGIAAANVKSLELSGAAGATVVDVNAPLMSRNVVPVTASDLMDFTVSSATPASGTTLQTDGTKQKVFGMQANVSNNDAYIPNVTFKITGSLESSNCELRINGAVKSTDYEWVDGRYMVFHLPEGSRVFDEGSDLWEVWCEIDGEAGQTFTPSWTWPAPYMWFYDNVRAKSSADAAAATSPIDPQREMVGPNGSQLTLIAGAMNLFGATVTTESIPLTKATEGGVELDNEVTTGTNNYVTAIFKIKVRGDDADLSSLTLLAGGTDAARGFSNCQIRLGQRSDKGEISTSSIEINDHSLSNFGGENNVVAANTVVTSTKRMTVGDWLAVVECDVTAVTGTYTPGNTVIMTLVANTTNVAHDIGTVNGIPGGANLAAPAVTLRALAVTVNPDATTLYVVANATDRNIGSFAIVGATQEDIQVTSIGITFAAGISGTAGCTTVNLVNEAGDELATSQNLTGAGTLTFSVLFTVAKNTEYNFNVVCDQASSNPTPATVTTATTVATMSVTGLQSNQSANTTPATAGGSVVVAASGTVTFALGTVDSARTIGPNEQVKVYTATLAASIHEDQEITTLILGLTVNGAASGTFSVNELKTVVVKAEGFVVNGAAAAAETTVCTRTVTGATATCNFSSGDLTLGASQTGVLRYYVTGGTVGNIGNGTTPAADFITATINPAGGQVVVTGDDSQVASSPAGGAQTSRVVTPAGALVRVVDQSADSRFESGKVGMEMGNLDVIVSGTNITWTLLSGTCYGLAAGGACEAGTDTVDVRLNDSTAVATGTALVGATNPAWTTGAVTQLLTTGTHTVKVILNDLSGGNGLCSASGETVQMSTSGFGFTVGGQTFAVGQTPLIPDFHNETGNEMKHTNVTCG